MTFQDFLNFNLFSHGDYQLTVDKLLLAIVILLITRLLYFMFSRLLKRRFSRKPDTYRGRLYAIDQMARYIIFVIGFLFAIESLGIKLSVLWAGAAALLVGFGLGMQQTFNDLVSGIILLIEGTVDVGDVIMIDGKPVHVTQIGIRTSKVRTQNEDFILVPNSTLVLNQIHNLSYNFEPSRFQIRVGVAYGSDVELVSKILIQSANAHPDVVAKPQPLVHFVDFGDSSLDFVLHFYSTQYMRITGIQSEIRYNINQLFREAEISIPFPQRDVWVRQSNE
ncbi:MAG: mechanosensitive ion channel [Saprospiraceae bacterium]|nr:mechanosensitive ion channel [Saprospiraceae bacterium]